MFKNNENTYESNNKLLQKEISEHDYLENDVPNTNNTLYPNLNDPNFNIKIALKRNSMIPNMTEPFIQILKHNQIY